MTAPQPLLETNLNSSGREKLLQSKAIMDSFAFDRDLNMKMETPRAKLA